MAQRQPSVVLMEDMQELWSDVFALEQAGKDAEAAELQERALAAATARYQAAKAQSSAASGVDSPAAIPE